MSVTICSKIYLPSRFIDENYEQHILTKLKQKNTNCDQDNGYITGIDEKITIIDNIVTSTGSGVIFTIKYNINSLKPEVGNIFKGKVCMIFGAGIFVEIASGMKVLVIADKLQGYKYIKDKNIYKSDSDVIEIGKELFVVISAVKYEKQNFNCIGSLKTS